MSKSTKCTCANCTDELRDKIIQLNNILVEIASLNTKGYKSRNIGYFVGKTIASFNDYVDVETQNGYMDGFNGDNL